MTTVPTEHVAVDSLVRLQPHQTLSILVHAGSKIGKTTLAATSPRPILAVDAEGSWKFIPARQVAWDPVREPPPAYDGTWDVCVVNVREWATVDALYRWLTQYQTPFVTVVIDSITELQRRFKAKLKGSEPMKIQDWDTILRAMDGVVRGFRDLTLAPWSPVRVAVFIAESRIEDGKWKPYMQGQIKVALPYWMDVVGFLYPDTDPDENGQATVDVRRLLITPHPQVEAGERVQGRLGSIVTIRKPPPNTVGDDVTRMLYQVYGLDGQGGQLP